MRINRKITELATFTMNCEITTNNRNHALTLFDDFRGRSMGYIQKLALKCVWMQFEGRFKELFRDMALENLSVSEMVGELKRTIKNEV